MTGSQVPAHLAGAVLTIDLDAVADNYRTVLRHLDGVPSAAVVKADGYGLGAKQIGPALAAAGCTVFFVAHIHEGVILRAVLPDAEIHILNGVLPDAMETMRKFRLVPVLGSLGDIDAWKGRGAAAPLPCDIHVDTGMLRLGLPPAELAVLAEDATRLGGMDVRYVMSHLASADEAGSEQNARQLAAFHAARRILPMGQACFANSSGVFLGPDYHFNMARPGVALYGVNPTPGQSNPMAGTVTLKSRILQVRDANRGDTVGYGASHAIDGKAKIATLPVGYADGYLRSLSNGGQGIIDGIPVPLVGRVSMDLITLDVTAVPDAKRQPGQWVELIGPHNPVDAVAVAAGTIGYEILTSLGARYHRRYLGGPS